MLVTISMAGWRIRTHHVAGIDPVRVEDARIGSVIEIGPTDTAQRPSDRAIAVIAEELWLAFVAASAVLLAIPGPTVLLVISYALGHGKLSATATVAGRCIGRLHRNDGSILGALLATSATLFTVLKWVGAAYLILV